MNQHGIPTTPSSHHQHTHQTPLPHMFTHLQHTTHCSLPLPYTGWTGPGATHHVPHDTVHICTLGWVTPRIGHGSRFSIHAHSHPHTLHTPAHFLCTPLFAFQTNRTGLRTSATHTIFTITEPSHGYTHGTPWVATTPVGLPAVSGHTTRFRFCSHERCCSTHTFLPRYTRLRSRFTAMSPPVYDWTLHTVRTPRT